MIRIDTSKIEKWEEIKEKHCKWFFEEFKSNFKDNIKKDENISDSINKFFMSLFEMKEGLTEENIDGFKTEIQKFSINKIDLEKLKLVKIKYSELKEEEKKFIKECFNYKNRFTNDNLKKWCRNIFLNLLNITVCPYCNRQYVTKFSEVKSNKMRTTADLDHFYPQGQYPYLALSLYNFVPSCHTCNSTMKGQESVGLDTHIYPYTDSMEEDIKFTIKVDSAVDTLFIENKKLEIGIDVDIISKEGIKDEDRKEKIDNSLKTFKLKEVYKNSHSKYIGDLIYNFQKYPKSYTKALGEIFIDKPKENKDTNKSKCEEEKDLIKLREYEEKLKIINENFQDIIKKPYVDRVEKGEPLAKLTKDIMDELGIK